MSNNTNTEERIENPELDLHPQQKYEIARRDARKKMLNVARSQTENIVKIVFELGRDIPELGRDDIESDFKWAWNHVWAESIWRHLPDSSLDRNIFDDEIPF